MITDTDEFFDLDDWAEMVSVNGKRMKAIYSNPLVENQDGFTTITSQVPQIMVQTSSLTKIDPAQGMAVLVRKKNYVIADVQDDGTGITTIFLHENF